MSNKISTKVKDEILIELVEPCYKTDIKELIDERKFWRKTGNYFESASKIFIGASSIVSFASGIYNYQLLSFFSGTTGVLSLVCMQFSSYSYSESKERTSKLNKLLDKLKIETVPDISTQQSVQSSYQQTPYPSSQSYMNPSSVIAYKSQLPPPLPPSPQIDATKSNSEQRPSTPRAIIKHRYDTSITPNVKKEKEYEISKSLILSSPPSPKNKDEIEMTEDILKKYKEEHPEWFEKSLSIKKVSIENDFDEKV